MPKLYESFGISVFFCAGEHLPVHVLVEAKPEDILEKWADVFVLNKAIKAELLTRRVK
jgi:hypothetical protein